jgi:hypothetical protein
LKLGAHEKVGFEGKQIPKRIGYVSPPKKRV